MLRLVGALIPLVLAACAAEQDLTEGKGRREDRLIGGRRALGGEFSATVSLEGCTAAKVGPRHFLTAAHCVDNDSGTPEYPFVPDTPIWLTSNADCGPSNHVVTVEEAHVFPVWSASCVYPCELNILNAARPPDVALVVVEEPTPDIAQATVDAQPVAVGDGLVITGYGCETSLYEPGGAALLKQQNVVALPGSALLHPASFVLRGDETEIVASNVITPGLALDPAAASLCHGDSGGPLYRDHPTEQLVVGVNAYYTFADSSGISRTNWHTRLDRAARYEVFEWLRSLGVNVSAVEITSRAE